MSAASRSKGRAKLKTRPPQMRCTCGKYCYPKARAREVAAKVSRETGESIVAYKCPTVGSVWHIGHAAPVSGPRTREQKRYALAAKLERERWAG